VRQEEDSGLESLKSSRLFQPILQRSEVKKRHD